VVPLFDPFLKGNEAAVRDTGDNLGLDSQSLAFFLYHSLRPSLCLCAWQLSVYLDPAQAWNHGYCPICGSPAGLAWLEGEGHRFLFCGFCWHKWAIERPLCPFCGSREQGRLGYLYCDEEPEYRLDVCESCRKYIKTVDSRTLARPTYPPLEQIASLHLELKAAEAGYTNPVR
jgi:FdhE protein